MKKAFTWLVFVPFFLSVAACNTAPTKGTDSAQPVASETKEDMVARRSKEFWDARIAGDIEKAYEYLSKGSKAVIDFEEFTRRSQVVSFRENEVEKIECDGDLCSAYGFFTYDHRKMKGIRTSGKDVWIIEDGVANYVFPK